MIQRNKGEKLMSGFEDFAFKYIRFILISTIVMLLIVSGEKIGLVIKYTGENPVACLWDEAKIKK